MIGLHLYKDCRIEIKLNQETLTSKRNSLTSPKNDFKIYKKCFKLAKESHGRVYRIRRLDKKLLCILKEKLPSRIKRNKNQHKYNLNSIY